MQLFTIRDVEQMSGIKAHTLRIWEQRFGLALPHRKESQHRYYTNEDLRTILRIAWLYHRGYKISDIAALHPDVITELIENEVVRGNYFQEQVQGMLEACKEFDKTLLHQQMVSTIAQLGLERAVAHVFFPFLEKLGLLWMNEAIEPAQEHFGSMAIRHAIITGIEGLPRVKEAGKAPILVFTPEEEYHEIPALFIHYLLRKSACYSVYMGANIKPSVIIAYCAEKKVSMLHYHQVTNFTNQDVDEYLEMWCHTYPRKQIVLSGPLTSRVSNAPPNALLIKSLHDLLSHCRQPFE